MVRPNFLRKTIEVNTREELNRLVMQLRRDKKLANKIKVIAYLDWACENRKVPEFMKHINKEELFPSELSVPFEVHWYDSTPWSERCLVERIMEE